MFGYGGEHAATVVWSGDDATWEAAKSHLENIGVHLKGHDVFWEEMRPHHIVIDAPTDDIINHRIRRQPGPKPCKINGEASFEIYMNL